jgi:Ser/Thr protein kinase RdoA (MazF antagonist)
VTGPADFRTLTPEAVIDAVESLGLQADGRVLALNSYENRVLRVGLEDSAPVVAKFYRPARWSDAQIREEHAFVRELHDEGLSVVPPLDFAGETLHAHGTLRFALFPLQGGHAPEMDRADVRLALGETLGRLHAVGARTPFRHREALAIDTLGWASLDTLLDGPWIEPALHDSFEDVGSALLEAVEERFAGGPVPCPPHWGGYLIRPDRVEAWMGGLGRLHDRLVWEREGAEWRLTRLAP